MRRLDDDALDQLAGEYVLGTLAGAARRRFEREMAGDARIRAAVAAWERRLEPLHGDPAPVAPPRRVWRGVCDRLFAPPPQRGLARLWSSLRFWRWSTAALAVAAAVLAVVAVTRPGAPAPVVAVIQDAQLRPVWALRVAAGEPALLVDTLRPPAAAPGRSLELWLVAPGGAAPRALGLLPTAGARRLKLPDDVAAAVASGPGDVLVSVEPAGGAPGGTPTGPVLYRGELRPRT